MVYIPPSVSFCSWTNNQKATQYYGDANPQYEVFSIFLHCCPVKVGKSFFETVET